MTDAVVTFTLDQAAAYLGRSRWTLRDQVTRGEVPHRRRGRVRGIYFTQGDLDQILAADARPARKDLRGGRRPAGEAAPRPVAVPEEFARLRRAR
jgi:hypothetical protein